MSNNLREQIEGKITTFCRVVETDLPQWRNARTPVRFRGMELEVAKRCRELADEISESILRDIAADPLFEMEVSVAARQGSCGRGAGGT